MIQPDRQTPRSERTFDPTTNPLSSDQLKAFQAEHDNLKTREAQLAWELPRPYPNPLAELTRGLPPGHIAFLGDAAVDRFPGFKGQ